MQEAVGKDHSDPDTMEDLQRMRQAMEEDFGRRRAKFKEMFLQKEEELKQQQRLVSSLQSELDDARTALAVSEVTFENQLDVERRKHAEEMASVQHLEKEQASSLVEDHLLRYQTEIRQLRSQLRAAEQQQQHLQQQLHQQHEEGSFGPHVLTDLTKQLAKKITLGGTATSSPAAAAGSSPRSGSQENLDESMKRVTPFGGRQAQEDTEMMRSLVIPLETEIAALKEKLRSTDAQLQVQLAAREQLARAGQLLAQLQSDARAEKLVQQLRLQLPPAEKLQGEKLAELAPHMYLYISVLEAQKLSLADDLKYGKQTQAELRAELERARQAGRRAGEQLQQQQRRLRAALPPDLLPLLETPAASPTASQRSLDALDQTQLSEADRATPGSGLSQDGGDTSSCGSQRDAGSRCERCAAAEQQLQQLQGDCRAAEKRRSELERALERHQQDLNREARYRKQTEQEWQRQAEQYQTQIGELYRTVEVGERRQQALEQRYKQFVSDIQDKLRRLTADRHLVQQELDRLQSENDALVGKHSASSSQLQNEFINLPDKVEDLHLMVLRYRDELISAKIAREHIEETLRNQLAFTKSEQEALQHERDALNDELSSEHEKHREEALMLESVQSELQAEQARRQEADAALTQLREQLTQQTAKSRQMQAALQTQLEQQSASKSTLTDDVTRLKTKVATLQLDLDNSEAVQRDFVKLSQSLQMELERIRQADTEVRWQHEDDVEACKKCSSRFTVSKRKHHCRHCGKIFCNDCLCKSVPSGPSGTQSRVCEVCHTLLNSKSAPYFSSQPPGEDH